MNESAANANSVLSAKAAFLLALMAVVAFHLAYAFSGASFLIVVYLYGLFELTRLQSAKQASYYGLAVGLLIFAPQLTCLWTIFGPAAIALWFVLAFWIRMFLVLGRLVRLRCGAVTAALVIPCLWTGLEYFRSELYYLRFSWLNAGYAFATTLQWLPMKQLGVYGIGFALMTAISLFSLLPQKKRIAFSAGFLILVALLVNLPPLQSPSIVKPAGQLAVAGMQLEFPAEPEVAPRLDQLIKAHPEARLLVLSEYTFNGPVPEKIKAWCRARQRYLIVGGHDPVSGSQYYNTAFVIGPGGDIIFRQAKSVPIQFFKDGLPARDQKLWDSPWGKIGLCICYDLSYTRVTDELVRLGAQAIIVPTMDVSDWGRHQHELHARIAPTRAAEYGIPIFRLASSGISQWVYADGEVLGNAPFLGDAAMLAGTMDLAQPGRRPWDRVIAPATVAVTGLTIAWLAVIFIREKRKPTLKTNTQ